MRCFTEVSQTSITEVVSAYLAWSKWQWLKEEVLRFKNTWISLQDEKDGKDVCIYIHAVYENKNQWGRPKHKATCTIHMKIVVIKFPVSQAVFVRIYCIKIHTFSIFMVMFCNVSKQGSSLWVTINSVGFCSFTFSLIFHPSVFFFSPRLMTKPKRENLKMAWLCHSKLLSFLTFPHIPCQISGRQRAREREREMRNARDSSQSDISKPARSYLPVDSSVSTLWSSHQSVCKKQRLTNHVNILICHHSLKKYISSLQHHSLVIAVPLGDHMFCVLNLES